MKKNAKQKKRMEKTTAVPTGLPSGWYFMSREDVSVTDIARKLEALKFHLEVWEEAGIIEVILREKVSVDIEAMESDLGDEYSNAFVADHGIKQIYYVSFKAECYEVCQPVLHALAAEGHGIVCGDTDDFTPVIGE